MNELRLSTSALNQYLRCGEKYRRRYQENEWRPFGLAAHIGTAAHEVGRFFHRRQMSAKEAVGLAGLTRKDAQEKQMSELLDATLDSQSMSIEEATDLAATEFDKAIGDKGVELDEDEKANPSAARGNAKDAAVDHSKFYVQTIGREVNPLAVEKAIEVRPSGIPLVMKGVLDLIDGTNEGAEVVDRKTSAKTPGEGKQHGNIQMSFYAALSLAELKVIPPKFRLEYTVRSPKRALMSRVTQSTTRSIQDVKELLGRVNEASKGITAGVFMPADPEGWHCSAKFCEFFFDCKYTIGRRSH